MSLISMTGFGRGAASSGGTRVEAEIHSVNRKQFDLRLTLPPALAPSEPVYQDMIHKVVSRGALNGALRLSLGESVIRKGVHVNRALARAYVGTLSRAARSLGLQGNLGATLLLQLPEVVRFEVEDRDTRHAEILAVRALKGALAGLLRMKRAEGAVIQRDLARRFAGLERVLKGIAGRAPSAAANYRENLIRRLKAAGIEAAVKDPQLRRELAIFADRSDVSEELVRLQSHLKQGAELLRSREPAGRSLDFLCQEMMREINTLGAKANDAVLSRRVVEFKAALECVREQVQNVE